MANHNRESKFAKVGGLLLLQIVALALFCNCKSTNKLCPFSSPQSRQRLKRELKRFLRVVAGTLGEPLMLGFALSRKFGFAVQRSV